MASLTADVVSGSGIIGTPSRPFNQRPHHGDVSTGCGGRLKIDTRPHEVIPPIDAEGREAGLNLNGRIAGRRARGKSLSIHAIRADLKEIFSPYADADTRCQPVLNIDICNQLRPDLIAAVMSITRIRDRRGHAIAAAVGAVNDTLSTALRSWISGGGHHTCDRIGAIFCGRAVTQDLDARQRR